MNIPFPPFSNLPAAQDVEAEQQAPLQLSFENGRPDMVAHTCYPSTQEAA